VSYPGPFKALEAKKLIRSIIETDTSGVSFSKHALEEMEENELETGDVLNVLRGGVVREPEWENGSWRYHVETPKIRVVVAFRSETRLAVVTAMRKSR
jgi:hypothetical protein